MNKRMQLSNTITCLSVDGDEQRQEATGEGGPLDQYSQSRAALSQLDGDIFVYAGTITYGQEQHLSRLLHAQTNRPSKVTLWLTTPGGDPDTAYLPSSAKEV